MCVCVSVCSDVRYTSMFHSMDTESLPLGRIAPPGQILNNVGKTILHHPCGNWEWVMIPIYGDLGDSYFTFTHMSTLICCYQSYNLPKPFFLRGS